MKTLFTLLLISLFFVPTLQAQVRVNDPGRVVERNVEYRANSKIDQGINKGLDKVEEGVMSIFKKKEKPKPTDQQGNTGGNTGNSDGTYPDNSQPNRTSSVGGSGKAASTNDAPATLKSYSKFDFVPGEKVVAAEDFMQDAIGDFPAKWNSSGTGEVVTLEGKTGHWLMLPKKGEFLPEYIKSLPENATLQFELACNPDFSFYSTPFYVNLVALEKPEKDFMEWARNYYGKEGVRIALHPQNAATTSGRSTFENYSNRTQMIQSDVDVRQFFSKTSGRNIVNVSIWRQRQRLRVYVNEEKIWDIPRAFQPGIAYNSVVFATGDMESENDRYYVNNIRLAVGAPDTRNKLITEGKFVTRGILFDTNSDKIKPESYGALKDIANVLNENADVKVRIIGHTDSDGDDASNMALSKKRAAAVKAELSSTFSINASRMETDGKGESQPAGPNTTIEGKANNRRVEFVKL
ncbi:OmpA family protein [Spirosoma sp. BT702]|uniref:OmpA family protein n=1 Tax=Spirosoma profusum TaxID=2771354 RepID=A0A926Y0M4_9BACT|nr:OmpA family protein [Spirosoma profusum]MBD2704287.1 OmpA family protein [Spirosoma profusum]